MHVTYLSVCLSLNIYMCLNVYIYVYMCTNLHIYVICAFIWQSCWCFIMAWSISRCHAAERVRLEGVLQSIERCLDDKNNNLGSHIKNVRSSNTMSQSEWKGFMESAAYTQHVSVGYPVPRVRALNVPIGEPAASKTCPSRRDSFGLFELYLLQVAESTTNVVTILLIVVWVFNIILGLQVYFLTLNRYGWNYLYIVCYLPNNGFTTPCGYVS